MYASRVETAAMMKTARRLIAYESRAARCRSAGSCATSVEECRILLMTCDPRQNLATRNTRTGEG